MWKKGGTTENYRVEEKGTTESYHVGEGRHNRELQRGKGEVQLLCGKIRTTTENYHGRRRKIPRITTMSEEGRYNGELPCRKRGGNTENYYRVDETRYNRELPCVTGEAQ